jgi:hypothetical protein
MLPEVIIVAVLKRLTMPATRVVYNLTQFSGSNIELISESIGTRLNFRRKATSVTN